MIEPRPALSLRGVRKRFGAVVALDGATLELTPGTVHALLGENGAGKSTLVRVAFGLVRPDEGEVIVDGASRPIRSAADAIAAGLGMVHQHFSLVPAMTASENLALGGRGRFDPRQAAERLRATADEAGLSVDPNARVDQLSIAGQQRLEILKAVARGARILMLDEPTAVLAPSEANDLLAWLRAFVTRGHSAVLITHKLREALAVADHVTVLRRGRTVLSRPAHGATADDLARAMVGESDEVVLGRGGHTEIPIHPEHERGTPIARATGIRVTGRRGLDAIHGASFEIHAGEIVGVAAVEGAGQYELLRAVAGRLALRAGTLLIPPAREIAFIPEDRHVDALVLDFSLSENVALRGAGERRGIVRWRGIDATTRRVLLDHDVRAAGPSVVARALSGGNQQKLVLGRELEEQPRLVVAENPTRGLDVHATAQIHRRLREARDRGAGVVLYSTDLDEVLALANRVLVLHDGIVREMAPERDLVGRAMLGAQ